MIRLFNRHYPVRNVFFVLGEGSLIFMAVHMATTALKGEFSMSAPFSLTAGNILITMICQICLYYYDMYNLSVLKNMREHAVRLVQALGCAAIILSGTHMWLGHEMISNRAFIASLLIIATLVMAWRFLYSWVLKRHVFDKTVLLAGDSRLIDSIIHAVSSMKDCGFTLVHLSPGKDFSGSKQLIGQNDGTIRFQSCDERYTGLSTLTRSLNIRLIVSDKRMDESTSVLENELLICRTEGIRVMDAHAFFEMLTGKLHVGQLTPGWIIFSEGFHRSMFHHLSKQLFDYAVSSALLIVLLPVILITAILIKIDSRGPVLYSQERLGKNRKPYKIYKFRSMTCDAEKDSGPLWSTKGDARVTRFGRCLRNWRIDEIPQLWNVLKGDMSFVGPRPERDFFVQRLEKTIPFYGVRFTVKPGITGWAQINYGYGETDADALEKLNYDLYYIKNSTVFMDLFIVFRTTKTVILGVEHGAATLTQPV